MNKQYRKEKFESRDEALIWVADNKPIYDIMDELYAPTQDISTGAVYIYWRSWHKAIEIVPEKRLIEVWVNVYPRVIGIFAFESKDEAAKEQCSGCVATIKLSKEITIVDGKVVEDEPSN